jgi:hypothetical protein
MKNSILKPVFSVATVVALIAMVALPSCAVEVETGEAAEEQPVDTTVEESAEEENVAEAAQAVNPSGECCFVRCMYDDHGWWGPYYDVNAHCNSFGYGLCEGKGFPFNDSKWANCGWNP